MAKFGLELSEEKSKIVRFGRFAGERAGKFDFLGFTHLTGKSRKGKFLVVQITSQKKLKVKKQAAKKWLRENMHIPVKTLIKKLNKKLIGHYNYYGISLNYDRMANFFDYTKRQLKVTLSRRSQKGKLTEEKFRNILKHNPLCKPRITRPLWSH